LMNQMQKCFDYCLEGIDQNNVCVGTEQKRNSTLRVLQKPNLVN
jgi:hypothetical protein